IQQNGQKFILGGKDLLVLKQGVKDATFGLYNMLFHVLKGQSLSKLLQVAVITAHQPFLQSVRHLNGGLMSDKGIAVTVSSGPESNSKDGRIFPGMQGLVQSGQKTDDDIRDAVVKNVFQIPNQTDGLIERSRLLPIDKPR